MRLERQTIEGIKLQRHDNSSFSSSGDDSCFEQVALGSSEIESQSSTARLAHVVVV